MLLLALFSLFLAPSAFGQDTIVYDAVHNATSIVGTWVSGYGGVVTGSGFAEPATLSFNYPPTTGISYSFTEDGFYEVARYRVHGNGSYPNCIVAVLNWNHGNYQLLPNGSIVLTPFADGYQHIEASCAAVSNFIESYDDTELYILWGISLDAVRGYVLQLYQFDGTPQVPMWQLSVQPNMLPTQPLRNVTPSSSGKAKTFLNSAGERSWSTSSFTTVFSLIAGLGIISLLL